MTELQDLIKTAIRATFISGTGYYPLVCKVCNDHKKRAGFKFNNDGSIRYKCFRGKCSASCGYTPGEDLTNKFKNVLSAYAVELPMKLRAELTLSKPQKVTYDKALYTPHRYQAISLPAEFLAYDPDKHTAARRYLEQRSISSTDFYVGNTKEWLHAPLRYGKKLVGYQSICLTRKTYLRSTENTDMIWVPGGIVPERPVICEGIIDAMSVPDGIAVLQSDISPKQAYILRNKTPVLLPDRKGSRFLDAAARYAWPVIIPSYKEKDANKAYAKYGLLVLAEILRDNTHTDMEKIRMKYRLWTAMA